MTAIYPTNLVVDGFAYTVVRKKSGAIGGERNVAIEFFRDDITYKANAHVGCYCKNVAVENPYGYPYIAPFTPAEEWYKKSGWSPSTDEEWNHLIVAFLAAVVPDPNEDATPYLITQERVEAGKRSSSPAIEEMVLDARKEWIAGGGPRGSHLDYLGEDYDDL